MITTRFAPSPTGYLHLGHVYAAHVAATMAAEQRGRFLVRMEDIDITRVRPEFYAATYEDLAWLGFTWEQPVWLQSQRMSAYQQAISQLQSQAVLYPCFCTRKDLAELSAPQEGVDGGLRYPGKCATLSSGEATDRIASGLPYALRLHAAKALDTTGAINWLDDRFGSHHVTLTDLEDVVISRKDIGTSYHLAVVVDDAAQSVTHVTRGEDLLFSTPIHVVLQKLLNLAQPTYYHHPLVRDADGRRLAKRDHARSIRSLRAAGLSAEAVLKLAVDGSSHAGKRK